MKILNLTKFNASKEQVDQGVIEISPEDKEELKKLLDFKELPTKEEMEYRAEQITSIAKKYEADKVMVGCAPFFAGYLELELMSNELPVTYSWTVRQSVEKKDPETGEIKKTNIFKHESFVDAKTNDWFENKDINESLEKNEKILNLTQHDATPEQSKDGIEESTKKDEIKKLITFDKAPSVDEMLKRAEAIADIAKESGYTKAMIGGAPYFDSYLRSALDNKGIESYYSFSIGEQKIHDDGTKETVFNYKGLIPSKETSFKEQGKDNLK